MRKDQKRALEAQCLESFRESVTESQQLWNRVYGALREEYAAGARLSADTFNSRHQWIATLELKPKSIVTLSHLTKIGRWTHRWWRRVEEFPYSRIKGRFLYLQRDEEQEVHYYLVFTEVEGYNKKGLKILVNVRDIANVEELTLGDRRKDDAMESTAFVRILRPYESERKASGA